MTTLRVVAVTDHDSTEGLAEAIAASASYPQLAVVSGIELGTATGDSELHLLGYFIDAGDPTLQSTLVQFRSERMEAARATVDRLGALRLPGPRDRLAERPAASVGRRPLARPLVSERPADTAPQRLHPA